MSADNSGPAFPQVAFWNPDTTKPALASEYFDAQGITMRDYFAAKAMQSFILLDIDDRRTHAQLAEAAYRNADAMLAQRQRKLTS